MLPLIHGRARPWLAPVALFATATFLHLILDSHGGGIMWGWPFSTTLHQLVTLSATQSHWVLSFLLHWTFLAEGVITGAALGLWARSKV